MIKHRDSTFDDVGRDGDAGMPLHEILIEMLRDFAQRFTPVDLAALPLIPIAATAPSWHLSLSAVSAQAAQISVILAPILTAMVICRYVWMGVSWATK